MLVLTRKAKQQILIGNQIVITILRVKGSAVRIGIDAPRELNVARVEVLDAHGGKLPVKRLSGSSRDSADPRAHVATSTPGQAPVVIRECTRMSPRRPGPAPLAERMAERLRPLAIARSQPMAAV